MARSAALTIAILGTACVEVVEAPIPSAGRFESMIFIELGDGRRAEAWPTDQDPSFAIDHVKKGVFRYALLYDKRLSTLLIRTGTISLQPTTPGREQPYTAPLPLPSLSLIFSVRAGNDRWSELEPFPDYLSTLRVEGWPPDRCAAVSGCYADEQAMSAGFCETPCAH